MLDHSIPDFSPKNNDLTVTDEMREAEAARVALADRLIASTLTLVDGKVLPVNVIADLEEGAAAIKALALENTILRAKVMHLVDQAEADHWGEREAAENCDCDH